MSATQTNATDEVNEVKLYQEYRETQRGGEKIYSALADGTKHGELTSYYNGGRIYKEGTYHYGKRHGVFYKYHINGQMYEYSIYEHGLCKGTYPVTNDGKINVYGTIIDIEQVGNHKVETDTGPISVQVKSSN